MSIRSDIDTLRAQCSEAQAWGDLYAKPRADMLRRVLDDHDKLTAELARLKQPKSTKMPQEWPSTDGMGL